MARLGAILNVQKRALTLKQKSEREISDKLLQVNVEIEKLENLLEETLLHSRKILARRNLRTLRAYRERLWLATCALEAVN